MINLLEPLQNRITDHHWFWCDSLRHAILMTIFFRYFQKSPLHLNGTKLKFKSKVA